MKITADGPFIKMRKTPNGEGFTITFLNNLMK